MSQDRLEQFVEGREIEYEEAEEMYEEELEDVQERATDAIGEEQIQNMAFTQFRGKFNKSQSVERDTEEIDIISLGHSGIQQWKSGDTLLAYGIVNRGSEPANKAVFIIDGEDVNLEEVKNKFTPMNALEGNFSVNTSDMVSDLYVCNSASDTEVLESDMDMDREERHQWVNDNHIVGDVELANITDHISMTNDQGYTADWGGDLRRLQGTVIDWFIPDDFSFGVMTVQDSSIVDPLEELDEEVIGDDADNSRNPGLTMWCDPSHMDYGEFSVCDFYGTIQRDDNGQITFNCVGIVPIMPNPIDLSQVGGGSSGSDEDYDSATEETSI